MIGFSSTRLEAALAEAGARADRPLFLFEQVDSTSSELIRRLKGGAAPGTVVVAEEQLAGRGRQGRSWFSPAGAGLYLSLAVDCGERLEAVTGLPLAAGVAAADAVGRDSGAAPLLKWPNDLMVNDRKVGGILCEVSDPRERPAQVVIGLGLNLARFEPPPELEGRADGLGIGDREGLAAGWIAGVERWNARLQDPGETARLVRAWRERAEPFGRRVRIGDTTGVTVDLDSEGRLLVERDDGLVVAVVGGIVENVAAATPGMVSNED
jgi:BirA family biotin operon repressor/biotin-[acetyl-CoA-carboxylase] ligase